MGDLLQLFA